MEATTNNCTEVAETEVGGDNSGSSGEENINKKKMKRKRKKVATRQEQTRE